MMAMYGRAVIEERMKPRRFAEIAAYVRQEYGPGDGPDLGEGGQGDRPGDRQRPQGEGPDRDEVRPTADSQRAISPPSLFWDLEPIDAPFRRSRGFCNLLRVMAIRPPPPWAPLRSARPVRLLLLGGGRRGDSRHHGGGAPGWNRTALAKASFEAKAV